MRILAIRGCNLASLDGDFAIEFDQAPLKRAGLFAITGPTGAGKSTILDALCLALFDEMPRLPSGRGALMGGSITGDDDGTSISTNDVRTILRRGTGYGWAEVDFMGIDGEPYRARWELRRAHRKATGKYQKQDMSLTLIATGKKVGDKKTDVLRHISRLLGLTVEQFRRAVLLPQGDFASFLKAPVVERSALLELLTGTEIYSRLSIAAHERAVTERKLLSDLETRTGGIEVLHEETRAVIRQRLSGLDKSIPVAERDHKTAQSLIEWLERSQTNITAIEKAGTDVAKATAQWDAAANRRERIKRLRRMQPLKSRIAALTITKADRLKAAAALEQALSTLILIQQEVVLTDKAVLLARTQTAEAESHRGQMEPVIEQAQRLDDRITLESAERQQIFTERDQANQHLAELVLQQDKLAVSITALNGQLGTVEQWLSANTALTPVAEQWHRWQASLARLSQCLSDIHEASRNINLSAEAVAAETDRLADLNAKLERGHAAVAKATADLDALQSVKHPAAEEFVSRRQTLEQQRNSLTRAARWCEDARRLTGDIGGLNTELDVKQAAIASASQAAADKSTRRDQLLITRTEAEASFNRLQLAAGESAEALRNSLTDGDPCPVCGGIDHPWANHQAGSVLSPFTTLLDGDRTRLNELRSEIDRLTADIASHQATANADGRRLTEITRLMAEKEAALSAIHQHWKAGQGDLTDIHPDLPSMPELAATWVENGLAKLTRLAKELGDAEDKALAHRRQVEDCLAHRQKCEQFITKLLADRSNAERALDAANHRLALARERLDGAAKGRQSCLGELTPVLSPLPRWTVLATGAPTEVDHLNALDGFVKSLADDIASHGHKMAEAAKLKEQIAAANSQQHALAIEIRTASATLDTLTQRLTERDLRLASLTAERQPLLDGQPVATVKQALDDQRRLMEQQQDRAIKAHHEALSKQAAAEQDITNRKDMLADLAQREVELTDSANQLTAEFGLTLEDATVELSVSDEWIEEEERELTSLSDLQQQSQLLLAERQRQQDEHTARKPASVDPRQTCLTLFGADGGGEAEIPEQTGTEDERANALSCLERIAAALDRARHERAELKARISSDASNRERLAGLMNEIEAQRQVHALWASMDQLMGSADGRKMRNFAQSLSLDMLLVQANQYLADLTHRYRLERIPGADLEIQVVDRDMADERRGVHSLSGGEMFLVSLALALGLSTMAVGERGSGIGTLFIDEGFGTLDPESLDLALSCLEALQASGRQVGVISHVPAMVDRIGVQVRVTPLGGGRSTVKVSQRGTLLAEGNAG